MSLIIIKEDTLVKNDENGDLKWDISHLSQKKQAANFLKCFEQKLCVYSPSVKQLYSKYSMNIPAYFKGNMVILPDPYGFNENFSNIPTSAIQKSAIHIIPGSTSTPEKYYIVASLKGGRTSNPIAFKRAMEKLICLSNDKETFLPVITKGDLREFNLEQPCIHLHTLKLSKLDSLSPLQKNSLKNTIIDLIKQIR